MRKEINFIFIVTILILSLGTTSAQLTPEDEERKVDSAYDCLINKIETTDCSRLSTQESIFALLAVNKCVEKVLQDSNNKECWPKSNCDIKTTAQAILALNNNVYNSETDKAEELLIKQNSTTTNLKWFLEIDTEGASKCTINYGSSSKIINIDENKKIDTNAGTCLTKTPEGYWLEISTNCYKEEFEISCDKNFITTLIFKKQNSETIYLTSLTHSASANGVTVEKINSHCFAKGGVCNYEGSLWASIVLDKEGYDISSYISYLIGDAEPNSKYLPETFLYLLTGSIDYRTNILDKQIMNKYWNANYGKYFDTALALYPFQLETLDEKTSTKEWLLLEVQQSDGCWDNGNIVNNAFILHSLWPKQFDNTTGPTNLTNFTGGEDWECLDKDYFCLLPSDNCPTEKITNDDCPGLKICCKQNVLEKTCTEMNGVICNSNEYCGGEDLETSDLESGEICCIEGTCTTMGGNDEKMCEENGGTCEVNDCEEEYEESFDYVCSPATDKCCVRKDGTSPPNTDNKKSKLWVWILLGLIILVLVGIGFRYKLKMLLIKSKTGKKKDGGAELFSSSGPRPSLPPSGNLRPIPSTQRRIIPQQQMLQKKPIAGKASKELDDVLKKLKDMSS